MENSLEERANFVPVGKCEELEVLDKGNWRIVTTGNLGPLPGQDQLEYQFSPFVENRFSLFLKRKEELGMAAGKVQIMDDGKVVFSKHLVLNLSK